MTERTLTALYDSKEAAKDAEQRLTQAGVSGGDIKITSQDDTGSTAGSAGNSGKSWWDSVKSAFSGDDGDHHAYDEGLRRGGYLLTAKVDDTVTERAIQVLEESHAVDFDSRQAQWKSEGWTPGAATALGAAGESLAGKSATDGGAVAVNTAVSGEGGATTERTAYAGREGEAIPIVEETLRVGKREVGRGGVRVRSYIVETPVNEQVSLREERIDVERRPVNQPISAADDVFRERTIEATATAEEAVIAKEAFVREELVLRKDVNERVQEVNDTVRHTEVDVDDTRTTTEARSFAGAKTNDLTDAELTEEERLRRASSTSATQAPRSDPSI